MHVLLAYLLCRDKYDTNIFSYIVLWALATWSFLASAVKLSGVGKVDLNNPGLFSKRS